jgi:hypothetical protein
LIFKIMLIILFMNDKNINNDYNPVKG